MKERKKKKLDISEQASKKCAQNISAPKKCHQVHKTSKNRRLAQIEWQHPTFSTLVIGLPHFSQFCALLAHGEIPPITMRPTVENQFVISNTLLKAEIYALNAL